jgi:RNAse (barnase) inhibitor barstar
MNSPDSVINPAVQTYQAQLQAGGVHHASPAHDDLFMAAALLDYWRIEVACKGVTTKSGLLTRLADTLHFPDHFGMNLDALYDCLTDQLSGTGKKGAVLVLRNLHRNETGEDAYTIKSINKSLVSVFEDAVGFLRDEKMVLTVYVD